MIKLHHYQINTKIKTIIMLNIYKIKSKKPNNTNLTLTDSDINQNLRIANKQQEDLIDVNNFFDNLDISGVEFQKTSKDTSIESQPKSQESSSSSEFKPNSESSNRLSGRLESARLDAAESTVPEINSEAELLLTEGLRRAVSCLEDPESFAKTIKDPKNAINIEGMKMIAILLRKELSEGTLTEEILGNLRIRHINNLNVSKTIAQLQGIIGDKHNLGADQNYIK
jgi:uncharacterized protein YcfL